jgi:DNA-binding NarL/FixJ family response regulator
VNQIGLKRLTARQRDVLAHLLTGVGEKRIAFLLNISAHTVHAHVRAIYAAFDVHSLGELMAEFLKTPEIVRTTLQMQDAY